MEHISDQSQTFAIDEIYRDGAFVTGITKPLNVVFIGDSLTAGDSTFQIDSGDTVKSRDYHFTVMAAKKLSQLTYRKVNLYNAGIGGTKTSFSAMFVEETAVKKDADIVFIENINDLNDNEPINAASATEHIIRTLAKAKKVPIVVLLHLLSPFYGSNSAKAWYDYQKSISDAKDKVAEKYNIYSINWLKEYYEITGFSNSHEWMKDDYKDNNVHPTEKGYSRIGEAVIYALENHADKLFTRVSCPRESVCDDVDYICNVSYPSDLKFDYKGFQVYTAEHPNTSTVKVQSLQKLTYTFPFQGCAQSINGGDSFSFTTTSKRVAIVHKNPPMVDTCNTIFVYVDGVLRTAGGGKNPYGNNYDYPTVLNLDGERHIVNVVTNTSVGEDTVYDFLCLVEYF